MTKTGSQGHIGKTAKHSAIYAIGTVISRITGLVMLPIYTRYLTPADYGAVELLTMALELAGILVGLRISQAMFRFYIMTEEAAQKKIVVSTVLFTVLASSGIGAIVLFFAAEPLTQLIFGNTEYLHEFQLFAFTIITNAVSAVGLSYIRARQKPALFVSIGVVTLALQVVLNIYFVVMQELHVTGVVYSALISGAIVSSSLCLYMLSKAGVHYSVPLAKRLIKYISPLILASLGAFYVSYADKYFLRLFGSLTDVGIYVLAARISSILSTVFQSFNMSWAADRFEIVKKENAPEIFSQVFRFLSGILILAGAAIAIFANDFFYIMTDPMFYTAGDIVPIMVLAVMARIYSIFCNFGILLEERTSYIAQSSWLKVIVATAGYLALIPYLGIFGAASVLLLSNLVELYWVNKNSTRLYDMGLDWNSVSIMLLAAVIGAGICAMLPVGELLYFYFRLVVFILLAVSIYFLPVWKPEDRRLMRTGINTVKSRLKLG